MPDFQCFMFFILTRLSPDSLGLPCWLWGCWSVPHTPCPCFFPGIPRFDIPPGTNQMKKLRLSPTTQGRGVLVHRSPSSSETPKWGEEGERGTNLGGIRVQNNVFKERWILNFAIKMCRVRISINMGTTAPDTFRIPSWHLQRHLSWSPPSFRHSQLLLF